MCYKKEVAKWIIHNLYKGYELVYGFEDLIPSEIHKLDEECENEFDTLGKISYGWLLSFVESEENCESFIESIQTSDFNPTFLIKKGEYNHHFMKCIYRQFGSEKDSDDE